MFKFNNESKKEIEKLLTRYPTKQAALLPVLWVVQNQEGWVSREAMQAVAKELDITPAHVFEVVTFYTMYNQSPPARHHVQVCRNICCWLRGSQDVVRYLEEKLGVKVGEMSADKRVKLSTVECLASCGTAPMMQINETYYENLTPEKIDKIVEGLK